MSKFKRHTNLKCPECESFLEIRTIEVSKMRKGIPFKVSQERIFCSSCGYESEIEQKRERLKEIF